MRKSHGRYLLNIEWRKHSDNRMHTNKLVSIYIFMLLSFMEKFYILRSIDSWKINSNVWCMFKYSTTYSIYSTYVESRHFWNQKWDDNIILQQIEILIAHVGANLAFQLKMKQLFTDNWRFMMKNSYSFDIVEKPVKLNREITCDVVKAIFGS